MSSGRVVVLGVLAVLAIACGTEPPAPVSDQPEGGYVPVADTTALVHGYAADAAAAAGAGLTTVEERKASCDSESKEYVLDVYRVEGVYGIEVPAAGRAEAVKRIRALWKSKGYRIESEPAPNDAEALTADAAMGLQPARGALVLPLYVNSACRTNPATAPPATARPATPATVTPAMPGRSASG